MMESSQSSSPLHPAPKIPAERLTPMFAQYLEIKRQCEDALLFYRMGDFYELFFDDAVVAAKALRITLTSRNPNADYPVPMCGVPHHAYQAYARRLIEQGFNVAVCDQAGDPKSAKGLVDRVVSRIMTPGTIIDEAGLDAKEHNYLGALCWDAEKSRGGFAWIEYSTGYWTGLYSKNRDELMQWVRKMLPRELLLPDLSDEKSDIPVKSLPAEIVPVRVPARAYFDLKSAEKRIREAQGVRESGAVGLNGKEELARACGALLSYIMRTQKQELSHLKAFVPLNLSKHLIIDEITERNLELFRKLDGKKGPGTLLRVLDETLTPMGGRLLEERLRRPWRDAELIGQSADVVEFFFTRNHTRLALRAALDSVYDLERLSTRVVLGRANPRDMAALGKSLSGLATVRDALETLPPGSGPDTGAPDDNPPPPLRLAELCRNWDSLGDLAKKLGDALRDPPPPTLTEGGIFRTGFNAELDEILELLEHGESRINALLSREQAANALPKLKLGSNRVFGYYFELGKAEGKTVPAHFIRRQTVANAERYVTPELKELEEKITSAGERGKKLEYALFQELRRQVAEARPRILFAADAVASLDFWQSAAECARKRNWTRPELHSGTDIIIKQGRHPVVEAARGPAGFVANDLHMDERRRMLIITGPNMAGKSTVLRQTAVIAVLAQMGCYVPAGKAGIGISDRIFSRVGASDNLAAGQSTFMVEMMETARILRQAGPRSLVILDEIGRGTSTFDGLSLAWAVAENLAERRDGAVRTLFATHYHELTALEGRIPGVRNMNIAVREYGGEIIFLRRLVPGPADRSYGIEVARLAGVPLPVVQRARAVLAGLESSGADSGKSGARVAPQRLLPGLEETGPQDRKSASPPGVVPGEVKQHPVVTLLGDLDTDGLTPMQALALLNEWKMLWGGTRDGDKHIDGEQG
jgi:DNA mismatch repair protein MutS